MVLTLKNFVRVYTHVIVYVIVFVYVFVCVFLYEQMEAPWKEEVRTKNACVFFISNTSEQWFHYNKLAMTFSSNPLQSCFCNKLISSYSVVLLYNYAMVYTFV